MTVKTQALVSVYEFMEEDVKPGHEVRPVKIRTHWVHEDRVVLCVGDDRYTVIAWDLILAVRRCSG